MTDVELRGCTPEPLMSYLKALGVFRLVAEDREHGDPSATLCWNGGVACLTSRFDPDALADFFLTRYRPTPILAPWNGGSGFYGGGADPLVAVEQSADARLEVYRRAITTARGLVPTGKPKDEQKESLLSRCRAELPDEAVPWLDVCFVLGEDGPSFFPLLGTGGNDGRLDFTNNFMQRLADVLPVRAAGTPGASAAWLSAALFADGVVPLKDVAVGQFNPGGIGGPNGVQGDFEAGSRVNPWDFVLMIEGALLFAGSVARRLGANAAGRAVFPFSVESVAVGYASATASEETTDGSRAELWLPLWEQPATLPEVRHLFAEGRAQLGRRQARNAVEFALAVNLLGVSRGVTAFARYGFLKRNGLAFLAAPLGRVAVTPRPAARLLDDPQLTNWIEGSNGLRRACREKDKTPARYQAALRQTDRAMFGFANRSEQGNDAKYLLDVLAALGNAERTLAGGLRFSQEKYIVPLQRLNPDWLLLAANGDDWREFRLAAALASVLAEPKGEPGPLRTHLEPVQQKGRAKTAWLPGSTSAVWANRPLVDNLVAIFIRRFLESERAGVAGVALRHQVFAPLPDVLAFLTDQPGPERDARDAKLGDLLWGLIGLSWNGDWYKSRTNRERLREAFRVPVRAILPWEFAMLRLVAERVGFVTDPVTSSLRVVRGEEKPVLRTTPVPQPFHQLARGSNPASALTEAIRLARRRLWADQLPLSRWFQQQGLKHANALEPRRLLAACLFPLSTTAKSRLVRALLESAAATK